MRVSLTLSIVVIACLAIIFVPQANALPVSYNTTVLSFPLSTSVRNSSSYDIFPLIPDNWLWEKFNNNTIDSSPLNVIGAITYNTNAKAVLHLENVTTDSTANGNNGVVTGTKNYGLGHEGLGFSFNGANLIKLPNTSTFNFTSANAFSVSFWVKPSSFVGGPILFAKASSADTNGYLAFLSATGLPRWIIMASGTTYQVSSGTTLGLNDWSYMTFTYDGSGNRNGMKIYINATLDSTGAASAIVGETRNTNPLTFGSYSNNAELLTGFEDELRVYSTNLSVSQVSGLYEVGHYSQSHTFDGGEYLTTSTTFSFTKSNPFSIITWFKTTSSASGSFVENQANFGGTAAGYGLFKFTDNKIYFQLADGISQFQVLSPLTYADGNYHYVAATYDGSGNSNGMKLYIDGSLVATGSSSNIGGSITSTNPLLIGNDLSLTSALIGQLDNLKIYPYALTSSQINSDYNSISPISSGKQYISWYHGVSGSVTLTKKLGFGPNTITLSCKYQSAAGVTASTHYTPSVNGSIYYGCGSLGPYQMYKIPVINGSSFPIFHIATNGGFDNTTDLLDTFVTKNNIFGIEHRQATNSEFASLKSGNFTFGAAGTEILSNQKYAKSSGQTYKWYYNGTAGTGASGSTCDLIYKPTNATVAIDSIVCDKGFEATSTRYWQGMLVYGNGLFYTNSTQPFLNSIDANTYKKLLSLPCVVLGISSPCVTMEGTDQSGVDWFIGMDANKVYFNQASVLNNLLLHQNRAVQSYDVITPTTTSAYEVSNNPLLQSMTLYGFSVNQTITKTGLFTIPSGYTLRSTIVTPSIRTIDPQWTNDATDIPIVATTSSLFPIFLTASNAPSFAAIKVTQGNQIINGFESVYAVAQLDSTRSVEFDLPPGICTNIYIADISVSPSVWNFQGIICATGVNQKTVAYTNTVPFTFYTMKYGVTDSFTPSNNALTTTFRTDAAPTTYTVIVRNSTGTVALNQTFTIPANQTTDTRSFNVSAVTKPAALSVTVAGNQVYSAYLGSSLSLASVASFFHQYFSYQGFDLLSFIPIIFASMFSRNTVGIGSVLVVVCMATLSWLSVVVIPETAIYVAIVVAIISMVGYRAFGY